MNLPKVQTHGINKNTLIKFHQDLLEDVLSRGFTATDEKLKELAEFSRDHSRVIIFGAQEIAELDLSYKTSILSNFDPNYGGINEFVQKEAQNRSYEDFSNWLLEKLKFVEQYFIRALSEIPSNEIEDKFIAVITTLETFLQSEFAKLLLPKLIQIEDEIKAELEKIYTNSSLSEDEAVAKAYEFLDQKEKESVELFKTEIQDKLNDEAIKQYLLAAGLLGLTALGQAEIDKQRKALSYQYLSNVAAFFFNSIRRVKETFTDNLFQGQRSLATDQLKQMAFNQNVFKLSVLTHPRALFRSLLAKTSDTQYFKALIPKDITLNPKGFTAQNLYLIKTKDEWSKTNGVENINVVDGLGLHHGSQEYYKPIFNLELEQKLAQEQRRVFLSSI